jgi:EF-P beta-lysylation protein EpmB
MLRLVLMEASTVSLKSGPAAPVSHLASGAAPSRRPAESWQSTLARAIRDPAELCRRLGLPEELAAEAARSTAGLGSPGEMAVLVPEPYLARIRPGDPDDPLLAQVLPRKAELAAVPQFVTDPLAESKTVRTPGLLGKYKGRVLIVASGVCAVHCRFCFRRHFPYVQALSGHAWTGVLKQIAADASIEEVILSGGDPLTTHDRRLAEIARQLADIPHVRRLRVHTRLPIVIPGRVNDELIAWLRGTRLATFLVVHCNHPAEIDGDVAAALGRLVDVGVPVLNQAVLMRGINDNVEVLAELCGRLVDLRVLPYYLHQLDRVAGAAHFEVPLERGRELIRQLRARLPGYAVPRYVRDAPGAAHKEVLE